MFNCPNCKSETHRYSVVMDDDGKPFYYCPQCPRPKTEPLNFPAIVTSKRGRSRRPPKAQALPTPPSIAGLKENSPEQVMMNRQLLKSAPTMRDTPFTRERDRVDKERHTVGYFSNGQHGAAYFSSKVATKFDAKFGKDNWTVVKQDGANITAERKH